MVGIFMVVVWLEKKDGCQQNKLDKLLHLISTKSGPKVNCQSGNFITITVVVEIADRCEKFPFKFVGHTGISIENNYYDLGPDYKIPHPDIFFDGFAGGVKPWWADPNRWKDVGICDTHEMYEPANFKRLKENMNCFAFAPTVLITFCTCPEKARRIEQYWKDLYQSMLDKKSPVYAFTGFNCSTSVWKSIEINSGNEKDPESLLDNDWMLSQLRNECGLHKGEAAHMELAYSTFDN